MKTPTEQVVKALEGKHLVLPASQLGDLVEDARRHTLACVADLADAQLTVPLLEIVNPFRWEMGHVAFFYDVFLLRLLEGNEPIMAGGDDMYDSFRVDHDDRWYLPLPSRQGTLDYMVEVKDRVMNRVHRCETGPAETYLHLLALVHEDMHGEAFIYMRQSLGYARPTFDTAGAASPSAVERAGPLPGDVAVPGGLFRLGASVDAPFVFDNEKWGHPVEVDAFSIARAPVTSAEFLAFVEADGYLRPDLWSYQGRVWRQEAGAQHPLHWQRSEGGWCRRHFDRIVPLEEHAPVVHVNWYEAEAYCNWADRRLPTEAEWELAASADSCGQVGGDDQKRQYPWGSEAPTPAHANLDARLGGCADVGAFPAGDSIFGCRQMIGNVWEWTASSFYPYPGFVIDFPYKQYSAPWFGYPMVLRGGAWATRSRFAYNTLRNFLQPYRNDMFAGFRTCARRDE